MKNINMKKYTGIMHIGKRNIVILVLFAIVVIVGISYLLAAIGGNHLLISLPITVIIVICLSFVHLKYRGN